METELAFQNLFQETPEIVSIMRGADHVFEFVNRSHVKTLGLNATGLPLASTPFASSEVQKIVDEVYTTGTTAKIQELPLNLEGRQRYFNMTFAARRDHQGDIIGVMSLGTDVTYQVFTRESFRLQKNALELALNGAPLKEVLEPLARMIEFQAGSGVIASILLADG